VVTDVTIRSIPVRECFLWGKDRPGTRKAEIKMTAPQDNSVGMFLNLVTVCNDPLHKPIWLPVGGFAGPFAEFSLLVARIRAVSRLQAQHKGGAGAGKKAARAAMCETAQEIASGIIAYAYVNAKEEMANSVTYTPSELRYCRDIICSDRCGSIYDIGLAIADQLVPYGVETTRFEALDLQISIYDRFLQQPRQIRSALKLSTSQLQAAFDAIDSLLVNQMDRVVKAMKSSQPAFYEAYQEARLVTNDTSGHPGEEVTLPTPPPMP
jgi:hypothetical protein